MSLKQKAKNIEKSQSMISEDYVHAFFYCACCGKKFGEADYRREDIEEMQKHSKPLCKNCAKFLSEWQAKNDKQLLELKQKLQQFAKYLDCFVLIPPIKPKFYEIFGNLLEKEETKMDFVKGEIIMICPKCGAHAPNLTSEGCPKCGFKPKVRRQKKDAFLPLDDRSY
jgi:hypothetical protein